MQALHPASCLEPNPAPDGERSTFESARARNFRDKVRRDLATHDAELLMRALEITCSLAGDRWASSLEVAELLLDQHADCTVVAAVLLGPPAKLGRISSRDIESAFGTSVTFIVNETCNAAGLRTDTAAHHFSDCEELLRAVGADVRVLVARIALRLVELESEIAEVSARVSLALETRQILVPLADRLGLGILRGKLEDACFRILEPETYELMASAVGPVRSSDEACLELVRRKVASLIEGNGVEATVSARTKSLFSLHRKMRRLDLPLEQILDRLGLRVIVESVPDCYRVLGLLHTHFRPVPGTFNDYVGLPKDNGYQSLHTCVYPVHEDLDQTRRVSDQNPCHARGGRIRCRRTLALQEQG